ncbi:glycosyltransferase [Hahella sp. KA22]|uniref:glycosyltransferase n=1 Tax=Hahella sp. KA22 TaxID=1628392 RepID=UPI000FDF4FF8|nr:glycosyltransferase [Hahella sp. KA22]AZZ91679.1 glycosyltransferase [Hahella sp. KA22]QAY55049.1 glycosyltransferase [Hahella sp. KA22]
MKIVLFIRSLNIGGAERQLLLLAESLSLKHEVIILTFYSQFEYEINDRLNYRVISLEKKGRWNFIGFIFSFIKFLRRERPDYIYSYMGAASIVAVISKLVDRNIVLAWGLRSSNMDLALYTKMDEAIRWLEVKLSRFSNLIISNSNSGRLQAIREGFNSRNFSVVHNGIDTEKFKPNSGERESMRNRLGISLGARVIGIVARHDPMKGLEYFIHAASEYVNNHDPEACFVVVGDGNAEYSNKLRDLAEKAGLKNHIVWAGKQTDVSSFYNLFDVYTSTSIYGEGFSNSIGEAMSSGVPCVVTDVGDSAYVLGDGGVVVAPRSISELCSAWHKIFSMSPKDYQQLSDYSRKRVVSEFSVERMVASTERLFLKEANSAC